MNRILLVTLVILSLQSYAQTNPGLITGNVVYENLSAAAGATVELSSLSDSTFKRMAVADKSGEFILNSLPDKNINGQR